ncbi:MAG: translocation/assembly module TamB domain-containing protein [Ruegeria sp.]|uniref:translocation/assembly module TamB domain-containing protein n=1 Tax=Ruegeria sp. TaxID=1879320 RepID=UPI00349EB039
MTGAFPAGVQAQDSGGLLVDFLESNLSGENRNIKVRGLSGALSSQATIEQITVADDEGIWLTINNAELDWNRLGLLRGRFSVNALTAEEILIDRPPGVTTTDEPLPTPEAQPFQLPELPVAVELGEIRVDRLALGEPLIGLAAELEVNGALSLADGALDTDLGVTRLDRPGDAITLKAQFQNEGSQIGLDLQVAEDSGGLISTALKLPGQPPLLLSAKGSGPITDFTADISLISEDTERVTGQVRLREAEIPGGETAAKGIAFTADLGGDVTPFLTQEFVPFFGVRTRLYLDGRSDPDGRLEVSAFEVTSNALRLKGELALAANGDLEKAALQGRILPPDGKRVVLPAGDGNTTLAAAQVSALFDQTNGNIWDLSLTADGLETPNLQLDRARLTAQGVLEQGATPQLEGDLQSVLDGLVFADPALNQAVGRRITLDGLFGLRQDNALELSGFELVGSDYTISADAVIDGLNSGFDMDGTVALLASDLFRFSGLAQMDLAGAVSAELTGSGAPLGGSFDGQLSVQGRDLATGRADIDPLITGETTIFLDAVRDEQGLTIRKATLDGTALKAEASAKASSPAGVLTLDGSAKVDAPDLAVFSALAGQDLGGTLQASVEGKGAVETLEFDAQAEITGRDLKTGMAEIDPLISGRTTISLDAARTPTRIILRKAILNGTALNADVAATVTDPEGSPSVEGRATIDAPDLSPFSALAGQDLGGAIQASVEGKGTVETLEFDARAEITGRDLRTGMVEIDPLISGRTTISLDAARTATQIILRKAILNGTALKADVAATVTDPEGSPSVEGRAKIDAPDLSLFSALAGRELGGAVSADADGRGAVEGRVFDLRLNMDATDLQSGLAQVDRLIEGHTTLTLDAANDQSGLNVRNFALNGAALTAQARGLLSQQEGVLNFSAALDELSRISTSVSGPLQLTGNVSPTRSGYEGDLRLEGPDSSYANLVGHVNTDGTADLDFDARMDRLERFVPDFPGTITATGNAKRNDGIWTIDTSARGPAEIDTTVGGTFDEGTGEADVTAKGTINLGVANKYISPNKIGGTARFDLALRGTPGLDAVSGTITTSGTAMAIPGAGQTIEGIGGTVTLANSRATIALNGGLRAGGGFTVAGPVDLTPPFNGQITTTLNELILTDQILYETSLNGQIVMSGPLAGNSTLAGQIRFGETNINLAAATGAVGAAPIPPIRHVGEPRPVYVTRERAKLVDTGNGKGKQSRIALDISLLAPQQVFVRGRGLNAELGGNIRIRGTTAAVVPSGQIELIRGVFNILGRRLDLTRGTVTLQGDLTPYVDFASTNSTSEGTATISIEGPLDGPEVKVTSDPERPSEEALALLLFGNQFTELSPFVIAQMAASLAQLSGVGGDSTKGLRDSTGADTIDVGADSGGAGRLGAGAYLGENLYTDFTVNTQGDTEVNLNLDVTDNFTLKGTVDGTGSTGLGIFFERDY